MPKATLAPLPRRGDAGLRAVRDPVHARKHLAREPGDPAYFCGPPGGACCRAHREAFGRTTMSDGRGKSDCCVLPRKSSNKAAGAIPEALSSVGADTIGAQSCRSLTTNVVSDSLA